MARVALASVAMVLTAAACSSSEPPTTGPIVPTRTDVSVSVPSAPLDDLETAVRAYSDAFLSGDADTAWDLLSSRCRDRLARAEFNGIVGGGADLYGSASMTDLTVDELSGSLARVTYTYDDPAINQNHEPWVFEDGAWHNDDC
jgi:hypothetical protein